MPKKKIITPNMEKVVSMRLDTDTWTDLIDIARQQGYSASGFMRNAIFYKLRQLGIEPSRRQSNE